MKKQVIIFIIMAALFAAGCAESGNEDTNVSSDVDSLEGQENLEQTEYQDLKWVHNVEIHTPIISKDLKNFSSALDSLDTFSLSTYSTFLEEHTRVAIEDSDSYVVSPELQNGKDEYRSGLVDANNAATFCKLAVDYMKKGDTASATQSLTTFGDKIESCGDHFVNSSIVINEYKKNNGIATETSPDGQDGSQKSKDVSEDAAVCYSDWTYTITQSLGQYYVAPTGYNYVIATIYLKNNADIPVSTNPFYWKFTADGLQYDADSSTYSEIINHQNIEVGKGGEIETTFVYLVKGYPAEAEIGYYGIQSPIFERIDHY